VLHLDILSSYTICGAGALLGAALIRPSLAPDENSAHALRLGRVGLALLGLGLTHAVGVQRPAPLWSQAVMTAGCLTAMILLAWAMAALAGRRRSPLVMWLTVAGALAAVLAALPRGTAGMTWVVSWGLALGSALMLWMARPLVLRPRDAHERLVALLLVLTTPSYWLRASYTVTWDGPYEDHLLHVPAAMVTPFALMYGVLPILFVLLIFNIIHARQRMRLHERAMTDQLTGALSRHALAEGAGPLIAAGRAVGGTLAVVMLDLDHFKRVNDEHGHAAGDAVLRRAAGLLRSQLRADALLVRYGGEEFVALAPVDDLVTARRVAERLRQSLIDERWGRVVDGLAGVTASVGLTLLASDESFERALSRADEALYRAKNAGRNQVQVSLAAA
jgi:diguanylate cyclase (GGDEF)-like protein